MAGNIALVNPLLGIDSLKFQSLPLSKIALGQEKENENKAKCL
jgi:hypothetical protein